MRKHVICLTCHTSIVHIKKKTYFCENLVCRKTYYKQYCLAYYQANKEAFKRRATLWQATHRERFREIERNAYHRKKERERANLAT